MDKPVRIQLSRAKGWRMPAGAVKVDRSTVWGNPFDWREAQAEWGGTDEEARASVVSIYRDWLTMAEPERFGEQLRGRRETRAVHHISLADIAAQGDATPFDATSLVEMSDHCSALVAHNMAFEEQWLRTDGVMPIICTLKAALRMWPDAPGHSNGVLRYWLQDRGLLSLDHETAMPPHRAGPDAYVTAHILKALLAAGATGKDMVQWTREPKLMPTCPIGDPWRGKKWAEVEGGFLSWVVNKAGMDTDIVWNARRELGRRKAA